MHHTTTTPEEIACAVICDIIDQWQHSWNAADAAAYADPFAVDADYITIHGLHLRGRPAIAAGTAEILATIYLDSVLALRATSIRCISTTTVVAQVEHLLDVPGGPSAGVHPMLASVVMTEIGGKWEVTTLHNTQVLGPSSGN